jgi:hypothetical protein
MLPYPYPHWKKHIRYARLFNFKRNVCMIKCVFCEGTGKFPMYVRQEKQPGIIDNPRTQVVADWYSEHPCQVCFGKKELAVVPDTKEDPWVPCEHCETYGRVFEETAEDNLRRGLISVYHIPCNNCGGLGFTLSSQRRAFTGETIRLNPLD